MNWGAEIFYGVCTAVAFGLSWKRGGPIAIAGSLVAAMWLFQGMIYWTGATEAGNLMGSMISAVLLLMIASLPGSAAIYVVAASLVCQLYMHVTFRLHGPYVTPFYLALNVLYVIQLIALGWSGGKLVLDELGDWMADTWTRWRDLGLAWTREASARLELVFGATARYYLGGNHAGASGDLWR